MIRKNNEDQKVHKVPFGIEVEIEESIKRHPTSRGTEQENGLNNTTELPDNLEMNIGALALNTEATVVDFAKRQRRKAGLPHATDDEINKDTSDK